MTAGSGKLSPGDLKTFFGHMVQAEWVADDGSTYQPVTVFFGLLRLWDSRAVWHKMVTDLTALEANIRFAQRVGAEVMFVFGEPPQSACVPGKKQPTPEAWASFVESTLRQSAGRIKYWELWNEPAIPGYWDGTPEELVEQSRIGYQLIKQLQPDAIVLSPSFTEPSLPRGCAFIQRYVKAGGLEWCDGVAAHFYQTKPEYMRGDIATVIALVGNRRIFNTEYVIGPATSVAQRQQYMIDSLLLQREMGIEVAVWNPEVPGSEDYTDPTMGEIYAQLLAPQPVPAPAKKGCNPFGFMHR
jgi:hypothetical protein